MRTFRFALLWAVFGTLVYAALGYMMVLYAVGHMDGSGQVPELIGDLFWFPVILSNDLFGWLRAAIEAPARELALGSPLQNALMFAAYLSAALPIPIIMFALMGVAHARLTR